MSFGKQDILLPLKCCSAGRKGLEKFWNFAGSLLVSLSNFCNRNLKVEGFGGLLTCVFLSYFSAGLLLWYCCLFLVLQMLPQDKTVNQHPLHVRALLHPGDHHLLCHDVYNSS